MKVIGLLAGKGELPYKILQHCHQHNKPIILVAFEGQTDPELVNLQSKHSQEYLWANFGTIGKILRFLKDNKVTHLIMAGAMERPSWSGLKLDWKGAQWFAKMGLAKTGPRASGDDWLLTKIILMLKEEGFEMISAADILDDLLAPEGIMGLHQPQETDWQDIKQGKEIVRLLGTGDIGQAVVVQQGLVLGVEAIEGTEALLVRCGSLRRKGRGGVLVKMSKPQQNRNADLPTIGISTIYQAHKAGLCGIVVEAGSTQILDKKAVIDAADAAGLYLVGIHSS